MVVLRDSLVVSVQEDARSDASRFGGTLRHAVCADAVGSTANNAAGTVAASRERAAEDSAAAAVVHSGVVVSFGRKRPATATDSAPACAGGHDAPRAS